MKTGMLILSQIAAGEVRAVVYLFLVFRVLSSKSPGKKSIAAASSGVFLIIFLALLTGLPDLIRIALETIWLVFCVIRFQNADRRISLFLGIFFEIAVSFWLFLFGSWLGVFSHNAAFLDLETGRGQLAFWLLHVLLPVLLWKPSRTASGSVILGLFAVVALSEQSVLAIPADTLDLWTFLAVMQMTAILVFAANRRYKAEKELARLKSEQAELLERDYTALNHAYAANARLFHDFHNHIGVLQQLLSHQKYNEAAQYLYDLQAPFQEITAAVWTGDETVDYLINRKAADAKACEIPFQAEVEFPRHTNLRSADLCAVLGNFLDNAFEAAKAAPDTEPRFIRLTIRRIHQILVIKVENSSSAAPIQTENGLQTTKTEGGLHGLGLKSAQTAAEKYDGCIQTSYAGGTFCAVATLFYQDIRRP
ncbi:MAG: GHKL domain-containing protein [Eubacteriales bacterium]|nr:GHKL domain-containing protein [Eubacteriales bacterium]